MNLRDMDITDLVLMHKPTGDIIDVDAFMKETTPANWEKTYVKQICEFIECGSSKSVEFLSFLLGKKDSNNMIIGSQRNLSSESGIGLSVVSRTLAALEKASLIRMPQNGCYMLSPRVLSRGNRASIFILSQKWKDIK